MQGTKEEAPTHCKEEQSSGTMPEPGGYVPPCMLPHTDEEDPSYKLAHTKEDALRIFHFNGWSPGLVTDCSDEVPMPSDYNKLMGRACHGTDPNEAFFYVTTPVGDKDIAERFIKELNIPEPYNNMICLSVNPWLKSWGVRLARPAIRDLMNS